MDWPGTLPISQLDKLRIESAIDESLRKRLLETPKSVLAQHGIHVPDGVELRIIEDTPKIHTIVLLPHLGGDISLRTLTQNAAASTWECTTCTPTTPICAGSLASLTCITHK
ncbi:hypothetical protein GCM10010174_41630 [Kutzneria viridogrisea]|uniref:Nitrile hydratase alpha /Thiocyanate hydrolase gamma domain-containing protein n=2 Tax=Kutzneria TaxID=43356 RepID=W5W7C3_9PSEU|nr:hypothetical protein [Kutzneria albida]AHH96812.1 hypothetical protein KALB_3445 [Kutzneria albida DSM 43870]MBA8927969.1 hypothetical protein [Kutzneria viridogrisea]